MYTMSVQQADSAVSVQNEVASTEYARGIFVTAYKHVHHVKHMTFKLRTETECGSLLCLMPGDPYVRSQLAALGWPFCSTHYCVACSSRRCFSSSNISSKISDR
jgi:hypothetical protein